MNEAWKMLRQGAEAKLYTGEWLGKPTVCKERFSKSYRHPTLDRSLTEQRTRSEVRTIVKCRMKGIKTPAIYFVDMEHHRIYMEHVSDSVTVKDYVNEIQRTADRESVPALLQPLAEKIGQVLAHMHMADIIHGDLTTSNMLLKTPVEALDLYLIDFGLGYIQASAEDKGVDLYVLERALVSTHPNTDSVFLTMLASYQSSYKGKVNEIIEKFEEVRMRGRKRSMVG